MRLVFIFVCLMLNLLPISSWANGDFDFQNIKVRSSVDDPSEYKKSASTLLISCADYRLRDENQRLMEKIGLLDDYDELVLPGASLALVSDKHPYWLKTADDIIHLLTSLHHIKQIIILDHKDCGAFKLDYGVKQMHDHEMDIHKKVLVKAIEKIRKKFPDFKVYTLIIDLDGNVQNLTFDIQKTN